MNIKPEMKIKQPVAKSPDGRSGIIRNEGPKTLMRKLERYIGLTPNQFAIFILPFPQVNDNKEAQQHGVDYWTDGAIS